MDTEDKKGYSVTESMNEKGAAGSLAPPKQTKWDAALTVMRAVMSAVPSVGSPAVELMSLLLVPPIERRRSEWMEAVAEKLLQLEEEQRLVLIDLPRNDAFVDTVLNATQAATRTASSHKREALRNAVLNSALTQVPDETKRHMFLTLVDEFTEWHLRLLDLYCDPPTWFKSRGRSVAEQMLAGSLMQVLRDAYPEAEEHQELLDLIAKDLHRRGLMGPDGLRAMISARGATSKNTTTLGDEFLMFIKSPFHERHEMKDDCGTKDSKSQDK